MHFEDINVHFLSNRTKYVGCGPGCPLGTSVNTKPAVCDLSPVLSPNETMVGCLSKDLWLNAGPSGPPYVFTLNMMLSYYCRSDELQLTM